LTLRQLQALHLARGSTAGDEEEAVGIAVAQVSRGAVRHVLQRRVDHERPAPETQLTERAALNYAI
jgi:hypothetical protein